MVKTRIARYFRKTQTFGVRLPKSADEAYKLDTENGNVLWNNAISKEMTDVKVMFKSLEDGEDIPIGYAYVLCHMIFDVKMEDFRRKARLVGGGHMTDTPSTMTYASFVSRETVHLNLVISAFNDLKVKFRDGMDAYITATIEEKVWTTIGPEFDNDAGNRALIVCALYGLKSDGADFCAHLGRCMKGLGY